MWNKAQLELLATNSFKDSKLIVVSNREPYVHQHREGRVVCLSPAGGLTSALTPVMSATHGTWIAQATGSADRETASPDGRLAVPPENPSFTLRRVWVPEHLRHGYYEGLSNEALWPLCHNVFHRPVYREADWQAYRWVNELFARAVLEEAAGQDAVVFVQDYHLALLPGMLKLHNPGLTVGQFWHIPFPHVDVARTFPWLEELLAGMLGNDVLGFHTSRHCRNFISCADAITASRIDQPHGIVWSDGHATTVREAPISIDFEAVSAAADSPQVHAEMRAWRDRLGSGVRLGIGIDRIDYTKGIPERLRALATLLERRPALRGTLTFVQIAVPCRSSIADYSDLDRMIQREAEAINRRWGTPQWQPIILERRTAGPAEMTALHRLADFCAVTPLHDGMNLVAKEFIASRIDGDGVLVLSTFAGAARKLDSAVQVNPYCEESIVSGIAAALDMGAVERRRRMSEARRFVEANNVYRWAGEFIEDLEAVQQTVVPQAHLYAGGTRWKASVA